MNIFYFDDCPVESAQAQPDKMLVKMPLETAQMLCTAHRELDGDEWQTSKDFTKLHTRIILVLSGQENLVLTINGCIGTS